MFGSRQAALRPAGIGAAPRLSPLLVAPQARRAGGRPGATEGGGYCRPTYCRPAALLGALQGELEGSLELELLESVLIEALAAQPFH